MHDILATRLQAPLTFANAEERAEFCRYPKQHERIRRLHACMGRIAALCGDSLSVKKACMQCEGDGAGWGATYLRKLYDRWRVAPEPKWKVLVDTRQCPPDDRGGTKLPADFIAHLASKFCADQRTNMGAWKDIIAQWLNWWHSGDPRFALPGYDVCPPPGKNPRHPDGWSYATMNAHRSKRAVITAVRISTHEARIFLPGVPRTRTGMRRREFVSADDFKHDRMVCVPGYGAVPVLQFGFFDTGMGLYLPTFGLLPVIPRADDTREMLTRRHFKFSLAMMLEEEGYPLDWPMQILLENGTAALSKAEQQFITELSGGQIVFHCSSMDGEHLAGFAERRTGRSTAKAHHEEAHKRIHNLAALLRMQTGKDRNHSPAVLQDQVRQTLALENIAVQLPPAGRDQLIFPAPSLDAFWNEAREVIRRLNAEPGLNREGFRTLLEWRPLGHRELPRPEAALGSWLEQVPFVREQIERGAPLENFIEYFPRQESAAERDARHLGEGRFEKFPPGALARFYEDHQELGTVQVVRGIGPCFRFQRAGRKYCFVPESPAEELAEGAKVCGFWRPDAKHIHLFARTTEKYLVTWRSLDGLRLRHDADEATKDAARKRPARFFRDVLAAAQKATEPQWEAARAAARNNLEVIAAHTPLLTPASEPSTAALAVAAVTLEHAKAARVTKAATQRAAKQTAAASRAALQASAARARAAMQEAEEF